MSAKFEYCHFCKKKHSLRSIADNKGNEVALYCPNKRLVAKSDIAGGTERTYTGNFASM